MPVILAIDTSTEACSCALDINGAVFERFDIIPRQHATHLLPMIDSLMSEHSLEYSHLDAIAVGRGPGSFTGLRIATGVAQGIAFGAGLPIVPVSTLAALAVQENQKTGHTHILSCIDARINEVYWGAFHVVDGEPKLLADEYLCAPSLINADVLTTAKEWQGVGNGMLFYEEMSEKVQHKLSSISSDVLPHAADIAKLASFYYEQGLIKKPSAVSPVYLRDKVTNG